MAVPIPSPEQFTLAAQALLQNFLGSLGVPPDSEFARSLHSVGVDSAKFAALQARYFQLHAALWQSALTRDTGHDAPPIAPPDRGDRRFSSAEWQRIPWFDYLRQSYLINSRFLSDWIEALEADPRAKERLRFIARQFSDAVSPANFAATNPEALKLALETKGESLTQGIRCHSAEEKRRSPRSGGATGTASRPVSRASADCHSAACSWK